MKNEYCKKLPIIASPRLVEGGGGEAFKTILKIQGVHEILCYFSKNSRKFAASPSHALGCYWLYKNLPANRSDCTLALRLKVSYSDVGEGGVAVNCAKTQFS